jgi:hypothetical protein
VGGDDGLLYCFILKSEWRDRRNIRTAVTEDSKGSDMVYNGQDYWVFGLCPLSSILKNTMFWKLYLF